MHNDVFKSKVLIESLPYFRKFHGKTVVIKYGGHAMIDDALKQAFALNIALLKYVGINPLVVHGGGPQIGEMLQLLNIPSHFREGLRITDDATMDVVEMVLVGKVNKQIVNLLNIHGAKAVGLSGKDGHLIRAHKMEVCTSNALHSSEIIDLGKVGKVTSVECSLLHSLQRDGFIPVIAPVGVDENGETYNINADLVAGAVAGALRASRLLLLTDVAGILNADGTLISTLTTTQTSELLADGTIKGGMVPKVQCCLDALEEGIGKAMIIDGRLENCILLELFTDHGIGTEIIGSIDA